jgi:hypothetical protein
MLCTITRERKSMIGAAKIAAGDWRNISSVQFMKGKSFVTTLLTLLPFAIHVRRNFSGSHGKTIQYRP